MLSSAVKGYAALFAPALEDQDGILFRRSTVHACSLVCDYLAF